MKAEYSSMRSLDEAMVRSCHTGTAVAAGGSGGAKGSYAGDRKGPVKHNTCMICTHPTYHSLTKGLPDIGGGTGPGRLVYVCAKGLMLQQ